MIASLVSLVALAPLATFAAIYDVTVGGLKSDGKTPNLMFTPNNVQAHPGDTIRFHFQVKNHTVTQSSFLSPCEKVYKPYAGFDSGFMPVDPASHWTPTFDVTVKDTEPIFAYCQQINPPSTHCNSGMVFAVNAEDDIFNQFLAKAKSSNSQNPPAPPNNAPTTYEVTVGGLKADGTPDLTFKPNNIQAKKGDKIRFNFQVKNHTVTQSSFNSPCSKLVPAYGSPAGFDSGFKPVDPSKPSYQSFEITVEDTKPIWAYCRQLNPPSTHCRSGMVFAVNADPYGNSFEKFLANAKADRSQDSLLPPAPTATTTTSAWMASGTPTTHEVTVGGLKADGTPDLTFKPNNIQAKKGDKIRFNFQVKNHTVTQSSFNSPCSKLVSAYGSPAGFDSGFMPVDPSKPSYQSFEITVEDTKPIWAYCRQLNPPSTHCRSGMVFAINADPYGNSFEKFLANAKADRSQDSLLPPGPTATTTTNAWMASGTPTVHDVTVGGVKADGSPDLTFKPNNFQAKIGDKIRFHFQVKNHTVTQSSFNSPCSRLANNGSLIGFDAGFIPVGPSQNENTTFEITVEDTKPIWGYCRQLNPPSTHCRSGMVFGVNADPNGNSFEKFVENAKADKSQDSLLSPGATPGASSNPNGIKAASAVGGSGSDSDDSGTLNKLLALAPVVLGLLGGAVALLLVLLAIGVLLLRRSRNGDSALRSVKPTYKPVPLTMPSSKMGESGAHDYELPWDNERDGHRD